MNSRQFLGGAAALWLAALCPSLGGAAESASEVGGDLGEVDYPVVITPTRLRQPLADVPASVTVVTRETMRRYGIRSIPDALRLVPGMAVSQSRGGGYVINYHGTNVVAPRRINVMIDGVSVYRPGFALVEWAMLPVALEDVDRIEVIRGPDTSAYGPNSLMAVVNILTKHPKDVERGVVSVGVGANNAVDTTVRVASSVGGASVRLTANVQRNSGYDNVAGQGGVHDSSHIKRLNLRAQKDLSDGASLDMQASFVDADMDVAFVDNFQASYPDRAARDVKFSGRWTKALSAVHEVHVEVLRSDARDRQRWTTCWPQVFYMPEAAAFFNANKQIIADVIQSDRLPSTLPELMALSARFDQPTLNALLALDPSALTPSCGQANQDGEEARTQLEFQDTYVVSNALRVVTGLGLRHQRVASETYFGGTVSNSVRWLFGHAEYRPVAWLTANAGGYVESNSLSGSTFSPRLALNFKLNDAQMLRAVVSKGTRTPDLFESRANWSYTVRGLTPAIGGIATEARLAPVAQAQGNLSSERILSRELGYLLNLRDKGLTLDVKAFDDELSGLVSNRLTLLDFAPTNSGSVRLTGAEMQASFDISKAWSAMLSYGYLLNRRASSVVERSQYSRHSGSLGVTHAFSPAWRASLAYYGASGDGVHESGYARTDLNLSHAFQAGAQSGQASLGVSYLATPVVTTFQGPNRFGSSSFNRRLGVFGQIRLAL